MAMRMWDAGRSAACRAAALRGTVGHGASSHRFGPLSGLFVPLPAPWPRRPGRAHRRPRTASRHREGPKRGSHRPPFVRARPDAATHLRPGLDCSAAGDWDRTIRATGRTCDPKMATSARGPGEGENGMGERASTSHVPKTQHPSVAHGTASCALPFPIRCHGSAQQRTTGCATRLRWPLTIIGRHAPKEPTHGSPVHYSRGGRDRCGQLVSQTRVHRRGQDIVS